LNSHVIQRTEPDDSDRSVAALLTAFSGDPFVRWMFPDPETYLTYFSVMLGVFTHTGIGSRSAYVSKDYRGAAIWLPPNTGADRETLDQVMQAGIADDRKDEVFGMLGLLRQCHPAEEHWYLQFLGVDPGCQGAGYGSALLEHSLKDVDVTHMPAFLVSSNARNQPLYERFGFRVTETIQSGSSPSVWPMFREAR
jgi:ribosomal protein S18 acetylase RimI-like enzyme